MFLRLFTCQTFSAAQTDVLKLLLLCKLKPQTLDKEKSCVSFILKKKKKNHCRSLQGKNAAVSPFTDE